MYIFYFPAFSRKRRLFAERQRIITSVQGRRFIRKKRADYSALIQNVQSCTNPLYHSVISKFYEITVCPIVVNTSFNVRGGTFICTPTNEFECFMGIKLDVLAIGNSWLIKDGQYEGLKENYEGRYELD